MGHRIFLIALVHDQQGAVKGINNVKKFLSIKDNIMCLPGIESITGLLLDDATQLHQSLQYLAYDANAQTIAIVEEVMQGGLEARLVKLTSPVFVPFGVLFQIGLVGLHATQPHAKRT